jgi:hypothetical protein
MKKFITRFLIFILIFAALLSAIIGGTFYVMSQASFKLPTDKHVLVLGASRSGCAIDDATYTSTVNVSQGAESYLYSYCKLRKFLEENSHIDTVLLSFQYASLLKATDEGLFSESYLSKISHHLALLGKDEVSIFWKGRREIFVKALLQLLINNNYRLVIKFIQNENLSYQDLDIGRFEWTYGNHLQKDIAIHPTINEVQIDATFSDLQKNYLLKIIDLCNTKEVTLVLINVPVYKPDLYDYPSSKLNDYRKQYLNEAVYLDYSELSFPDSCYRDVDHLNIWGARMFSEYLKLNLANDVEKYKNSGWLYAVKCL